jgi:hypothetical protein
MKYIKYSSIFLLLILLVTSCREDSSDLIAEVTEGPVPVIKIEASFNGQVIDYNEEPLAAVTISLGQESTQTDDNGYFELSGLANQNGAFIKATKSGYWEAYGNVLPSKDGTAFVKFKLKERTVSGIINTGQDQIVSLDNDSEISFKANSIVDKNGQSYSGNVNVYAEYIDPTAADFSLQMPGDLNAITLETEERILLSYGMLNVELESDSGQELNVNQPTGLKFNVPESLGSTAPQELPLWYYDDQTGLWMEEGSAILVNGYYEGEVSHFTLWNCDVPMPHVLLTGNVAARGPLANTQIYVTWVEEGQTLSTFADENGDFSGKVPANAILVVKMFDDCNNLIYEEEIGPLTEDFFLQIIIDPEVIDVFTVSGTLLCEGSPVSEGYVVIQPDGASYQLFAQTDENGDFSLESLVCDAETFTVIATDINSGEQGEPQSYTIADEVMIGDVEACGIELQYLVEVNVDGGSYVIPDPTLIVDQSGQDSLGYVYEFRYDHVFTPDDKVTINLTVIDWNNNPNDPLYGFAYSFEIFGNPGDSYVPIEGQISLVDYGAYVELYFQDTELSNVLGNDFGFGSYFIRALKQ